MKDSVFLLVFLSLFSCNQKGVTDKSSASPKISELDSIQFQNLFEMDDLSVRAVEIDESGMIGYSANAGQYGFIDPTSGIDLHGQIADTTSHSMEFRGFAFHSLGASFISAGNPAQLYRVTYTDWTPTLVYEEIDEKVFYDSMSFWNDEEGIAFGDAMNGCMSVLITRNGGKNWKKLSCDEFPAAYEGEGAFAASDTNVEVVGDHTWLASKHKIYYSPDKGNTWQVFDTPIIQDTETQGIYSLDFYDASIGVAIGGDYTQADANSNNLIRTEDGGKTWNILSSESSPGYRSCVQFIPNSGGQGLLAVGYKGVDVSFDGGLHWKHISDEGFYTARFLNETEGVVAGRGRIAKFTLLP